MNRPLILFAVLIVQGVCAFFFIGRIAVTVLGIPVPPINWTVLEWIEIGAALGLAIGFLVSLVALRRSLRRTAQAEQIIADLSGAFMDLVEAHFLRWQLSPAERDVALFLIKGLSTAEIAGFRGTSEGTVKAQTNAIYRKAEVGNRAQLVSLLIDDLMMDDVLPAQASSA